MSRSSMSSARIAAAFARGMNRDEATGASIGSSAKLLNGAMQSFLGAPRPLKTSFEVCLVRSGLFRVTPRQQFPFGCRQDERRGAGQLVGDRVLELERVGI